MSAQTLESSASLAQRTSVAGAASTAATPQTASLDGSSSLIGKRPASRDDNLRDDQEGRPTIPGGGPAIREATPQTSGPDAVSRITPASDGNDEDSDDDDEFIPRGTPTTTSGAQTATVIVKGQKQ